MAASIILIVDGKVVRDDGDVIKNMLLTISVFVQFMDKTEAHVAQQQQQTADDIASLRTSLADLTTKLQDLLDTPALVGVAPAEVAAVASQVRANTAQLHNIAP